MKLARRVIEQEQLTVKTVCPDDHIIRLLDKSDLPAVMQLQASIVAALGNKELYVPISAEEMGYILAGNGESLGVFIKGRLYAACSLLFNVRYENNMARELNFSNDQLALVAQLELSLVDPFLRGAKWQHKLAGILARREEERKANKYLFSTASPYNYASIKTLTALGLQIARLSQMYYNWDRYVLYKDFTRPAKLDKANAVCLPNTSFAQQRQLLDNGYRGYSLLRDQAGIKILFAPPILI